MGLHLGTVVMLIHSDWKGGKLSVRSKLGYTAERVEHRAIQTSMEERGWELPYTDSESRSVVLF